MQLQDVVSETHEGPFALHFDQTAKREPAESADLLDLPEHRFNDRLAPGIDGCTGFGLQLPAHAIDACRALGQRTARANGRRIRVFLAARCYIGVYLSFRFGLRFQIFQVAV